MLPDFVYHGLVELKRFIILFLPELKMTGRLLPPHFPRHIEFDQSPEDSQASACMSIVVAIHDAPEVLRRCLASLEKYAPESEIILVDDASRLSETVEVIRDFSTRNKWKVIRHKKSLGHSEACREGALLVTRPYICLLNSDTVVTPWCWHRVKEVFEHDRKIGVAGPSRSYSGNPQALALATVLGSYWSNNQICSFAHHLLAQCREPVVMDVPWVSGFAFFIRRSLWEQVGGFDQNLPDYGNELELCSRIAEEGYRMVWIRNSYIHHYGQRSYARAVGKNGVRTRCQAADSYIRQKSDRRPHKNIQAKREIKQN
jgi:GT2 family glycosyltransferase